MEEKVNKLLDKVGLTLGLHEFEIGGANQTLRETLKKAFSEILFVPCQVCEMKIRMDKAVNLEMNKTRFNLLQKARIYCPADIQQEILQEIALPKSAAYTGEWSWKDAEKCR